MKFNSVSRAFLFSIFSLFLFENLLFASPAQDEDFGIWSQNDIEKKLNNQWKIKAGEELRFREHAGIVYYDTHLGANYKPWEHLALGADYLQVRQIRTVGKKDVWYWEERPRIYITPQQKIYGFLFENRNMFEFRFKEEIENTMRYRNMTTLTAPWKWTRFEFQPYAANELFIETNRNGLVEDRWYTGLKMRIWKSLSGSLFYLRQFQKNSKAIWKDSNILGIGLKITL